MEPQTLEVRNARVHNLRNVSLSLPRGSLIVFTGVSGSGKSSLAFDTLYAEGQRRYIESLSSYARQFMGQMEKPDCDQITGLSPAIAIQQKTAGWNPRSTVGTVTAIYDYLRVVYAQIGVQHCTSCGRVITAQSRDQIVAGILSAFGENAADESPNVQTCKRPNARADAQSAIRNPQLCMVLAPVARGQKGEFRDLFDDLSRAGYVRARVDGQVIELRDDISLVKNQRHDIEVVIDRLRLDSASRSRLAEAVQRGLELGEGTVIIAELERDDDKQGERPGGQQKAKSARERVFSSKFACTHCSLSFEPPTPQLFSFNSPEGMCPSCDGLGELFDFDPDLLIPDSGLSFLSPCIVPMRKIGRWRRHVYEGVAKALGVDLKRPWKTLPKSARQALLYGTGDRHITFEWHWSGGVWKHGGPFPGVITELRETYRKTNAKTIRAYYEKYMRRGACTACNGARLKPQALAVRLPGSGKDGPAIHELCAMSIADASSFLAKLELTPVQHMIADELLKELRTRLAFLLNVGLEYLTLSRGAPTLSGGESQRIRLAGQIGAGLVGVLYILDEPSIGLHHRDNEKLLASLAALRDLGNTVIVVEHDEATMRAADYVVDFGPGPGIRGGEVVASGTFDEIAGNEKSLTGRYLIGERRIEVPKVRRPVAPARLKGKH